MYGSLRVLWVLCNVGGLIISPKLVKRRIPESIELTTFHAHASTSVPASLHTAKLEAIVGGDVNVPIETFNEEKAYGFWTQTTPILRKDPVESTKRGLATWMSFLKLKPIINDFKRIVLRTDPHQDYYTLAQKMRQESATSKIREIGQAISRLKKEAPSLVIKPESDLLVAITRTIDDIISWSMQALTDMGITEKERIWVLASLSYLEQHLGHYFPNPFKKLEPGVRLSRGELELELTKGKITLREVRELFSNPEKDISDKTVKEALQRVAVLASIHQSLRDQKPKTTTLEFAKLHDYLLKTELPDTNNEITGVESPEDESTRILNYIKMVTMNIHSTELEKTHTHEISYHLYKYNLPYNLPERLTQTLTTDQKFRVRFNRIKAQQICQEVFQDDELTQPAQELLEPFKDLESLDPQRIRSLMEATPDGQRTNPAQEIVKLLNNPESLVPKNVVSAIKAITSAEDPNLGLHDRIQIYKVVEAVYTFNQVVHDLWETELHENIILSPWLAKIWFKLYPTLEPPDFSLVELESLYSWRRPTLLQAARRQILLNEIEEITAAKSEISVKLSNLGKLSRQKTPEAFLTADQVYINLFAELGKCALNPKEHQSDKHYQMLLFESLCQILDWDEKYYGRLIEDLGTEPILSDQIEKLCHQVVLKDSSTSGIAPLQLRKIVDRLLHEYIKAQARYTAAA
ncbi:hypothetical protein CROQUDRAFT_714474 [Cronartium quercuum f. sp. fusiforme G11]|uniref:Uncharacterized protein n=1 Tax=Cronartium quercuum f. sp. fusiforme G11 TaxID=708437 RepID=A0A9P6TDL3_9BASI|nr:hypothetical protein CROQUDRAFT_714474 [Cronartium quercuum f. sp. fusiforme G11]